MSCCHLSSITGAGSKVRSSVLKKSTAVLAAPIKGNIVDVNRSITVWLIVVTLWRGPVFASVLHIASCVSQLE